MRSFKYRLTTAAGIVALTLMLVAVPVLLASQDADWHFNGTAIEACSCPMFCQCYFNTEPASHEDHDGEHFCKFNMAYKVHEGHHGETDLSGVKFWVAGDLGAKAHTILNKWQGMGGEAGVLENIAYFAAPLSPKTGISTVASIESGEVSNRSKESLP